MPLLTIVEDYLIAALQHAVVDATDEGSLVAYVPEIRGLVAFGADRHECTRELYLLLEEWVQKSLRSGKPVPILNNIDLSSEADRVLATYDHPFEGKLDANEFYFCCTWSAVESLNELRIRNLAADPEGHSYLPE